MIFGSWGSRKADAFQSRNAEKRWKDSLSGIVRIAPVTLKCYEGWNNACNLRKNGGWAEYAMINRPQWQIHKKHKPDVLFFFLKHREHIKYRRNGWKQIKRDFISQQPSCRIKNKKKYFFALPDSVFLYSCHIEIKSWRTATRQTTTPELKPSSKRMFTAVRTLTRTDTTSICFFFFIGGSVLLPE